MLYKESVAAVADYLYNRAHRSSVDLDKPRQRRLHHKFGDRTVTDIAEEYMTYTSAHTPQYTVFNQFTAARDLPETATLARTQPVCLAAIPLRTEIKTVRKQVAPPDWETPDNPYTEPVHDSWPGRAADYLHTVDQLLSEVTQSMRQCNQETTRNEEWSAAVDAARAAFPAQLFADAAANLFPDPAAEQNLRLSEGAAIIQESVTRFRDYFAQMHGVDNGVLRREYGDESVPVPTSEGVDFQPIAALLEPVYHQQ